MIVSLRGKSTIVRKVMDLYETEHKVYEKGRKKTLCQTLSRPDGLSLMVPGHLGSKPPSLSVTYHLIEAAQFVPADVLYEASDGPQRLIAMHKKGWPVAVVAIKADTDALQKQVETFKKAGVPAWHLSRAAALKKVRELLDV